MSRPTFPTIWTNRTPIDRRRQDKCATVNGWRQWLWIVSSQHDALIIHKRLRQGCGVSLLSNRSFSQWSCCCHVCACRFLSSTAHAQCQEGQCVRCVEHHTTQDTSLSSSRWWQIPATRTRPWLHTNWTSRGCTPITLQRTMTCNETGHTIQLRLSDPKITQVLLDVGHSGRYSEHHLSYDLVKCFDQAHKQHEEGHLAFPANFHEGHKDVSSVCALTGHKHNFRNNSSAWGVVETAMPCSACPSQWSVVLEKTGWVVEAWQCTGLTAVTVPDVTDRHVDVKGPPRAVVWERVACDGAVTWGSKTPSQMQWLVPAVSSSPQAECHRPMQIPSGAFPVDAELEGGGHKKMTRCDRPFNLVGNEQMLFHKLNLEAHIMVSRLTFSV